MKNSASPHYAVLKGAPYPVLVGRDFLAQVADELDFAKYSRIAVVVDDTVFSLWEETLTNSFPASASVIRIGISEPEKSIESVSKLWKHFLAHKLDRKALVLAVGGGALCDVVGFAAATYMRGCACIMVPTTLLAQVDASVGGKTGFNFGGIKNLVGVISDPCGVVIDVSFLSTLASRDYSAGIAEMLKHGLIADVSHFNQVATFNPNAEALPSLLENSLQIKLNIVRSDPSEQGPRELLNFGHSLGHAIEASSLECGHALSHGEAVAIGMVGEAFLSVKQGWLTMAEVERIEEALLHWNLPIRIPPAVSREAIISKSKCDKKNVAGNLRMTLLRALGQAEFNCPVSSEAFSQCLDYVFLTNQSK